MKPRAAVVDARKRELAPWAPPLFLALLAVATFAAGLGGGFVLDDNYAVTGHPVVQGTAPLLDAFRLTFWGNSLDATPPSFRPLTTLSFALDQRLLGGSAVVFHLSSLLWYVGLVLALWAFARRSIGQWPAFLATAFFVVMPVHVENVSSIVGRADTLGVLFSLLALVALSPMLLKGEARSPLRLVLAALAFAAALLSKESMAALPLVVALLARYRDRAGARLLPLRTHLPSLVMAGVLGLYLVLRLAIQPGTFSHTEPDDVLVGADVWEKLGYGFELLARYTRLVVAPTDLCTGRKFAEVFRPEELSLAMLAGVAIFGIGVRLAWQGFRKGTTAFLPAAFASWFLVTGLLFAMPESMADRFLLLPSVFICLAAGPALLSLWRRSGLGKALVLTTLAVQVALSNFQALTWRDEGTLLSHAVRVCPNSVHNHYRYAEYLSSRGEAGEAVWHYALVTKGRHAFPHAWSHPALDQELTMPIDERLREMHDLLGVSGDESVWRSRFGAYLRSLGRSREASLVDGQGEGG